MRPVLTVREGDHEWLIEDPGQHIGRIIAMSGGPYEVGVLRHMADTYRRRGDGFVVDVGAHVGNHTLYMAAVTGAAVIAVEPSPVNFGRLSDNVALNPSLGPLILECNTALGAAPGTASYHGAPADDITWGKAPARPDPDGALELTTLDQLLDDLECGDLPVALVKIDVEGMEPAVIAGAGHTLLRCSPVVYAEARDDAPADANERVLATFGYRLTAVLNRRRTPVQVWER